MTIPSLPAFYDMPFTDDKGRLTSDARNYFDQQFQTLNQIVEMFNDGIQIPHKTAVEITALALEPTTKFGTIWYDTDNNVLKYLDDVGIKEITATP